MEKCEVISGFAVFPFPEKPDYLPISNEEFKQRTLEAWTHGDVNSRVSAAFRGGEQEWALLWNDESYSVRGAVACRASEEYQLKLVNEPVFAVRKMLAIYGTDRVRLFKLHGQALQVPLHRAGVYLCPAPGGHGLRQLRCVE